MIRLKVDSGVFSLSRRDSSLAGAGASIVTVFLLTAVTRALFRRHWAELGRIFEAHFLVVMTVASTLFAFLVLGIIVAGNTLGGFISGYCSDTADDPLFLGLSSSGPVLAVVLILSLLFTPIAAHSLFLVYLVLVIVLGLAGGILGARWGITRRMKRT